VNVRLVIGSDNNVSHSVLTGEILRIPDEYKKVDTAVLERPVGMCRVSRVKSNTNKRHPSGVYSGRVLKHRKNG
jgi:hypothetical protein